MIGEVQDAARRAGQRVRTDLKGDFLFFPRPDQGHCIADRFKRDGHQGISFSPRIYSYAARFKPGLGGTQAGGKTVGFQLKKPRKT